jgi:phosphodiesterase/alkaline phosphatase D-like protein
VTQNSYGTTYGSDQQFQTIEPDLPQAGSASASDIDQDSATVSAQVDPGFGLTLYRFEYGQDTSYGRRTAPGGPIDPESTELTATAVLEELAPGTTYHYRVRLTNFSGSTVGSDHTFTTASLPVIVSASASPGETTATLSATINPSLSPTTYHFEIGTDTSYGAGTPESQLGSGGSPQSVSLALSGLKPATTYHYRVVAQNGVGGAVGNDQTFTTAAPPPAQTKPAQPTKCKKGFVKKNGKCVKKKPKNKRKRGKRG